MIKKILIVTGLGLLILGFWLQKRTFQKEGEVALSNKVVSEPPKELEEITIQTGSVIISVKPVRLEVGEDAVFKVSLDTHSTELEYDIVKLSLLEDGRGNKYEPEAWSGGKGGHHLSGDLTFGKMKSNPEIIKLVINEIDNQPAVFEWKI